MARFTPTLTITLGAAALEVTDPKTQRTHREEAHTGYDYRANRKHDRKVRGELALAVKQKLLQNAG